MKDFNKQLEDYSIKNSSYLEHCKEMLKDLKRLKQNDGKNLKLK